LRGAMQSEMSAPIPEMCNSWVTASGLLLGPGARMFDHRSLLEPF